MSTPKHVLPPKFDASDPCLQTNPYPIYARLRDAGRLCRGGPAEWVVTRYADVAALLSDRRLRNQFPSEYHDLSAGDGPAREFLEHIMLHRDGAEHTTLRKAMVRHFDGAALRNLQRRITNLVDELLASASESGTLEVVGDLALPLTTSVMFEIMGIPSDDRDDIHHKILDLGKAFASHVADEDRLAANDAVMWLRRYVSDLLEQNRLKPEHDLLSDILMTELEGRGVEEIVDNVVFLFFAGFETTSSVISSGCAALVNHPDQLMKLQNDRSLVPRAVEEFMRYDAPIQSRLRFVEEPLEIDGRIIKPGRLLLLLVGSANHDERQFDSPEDLDITRHPNPHVSFGGGAHYCLGAGLARLECTIFFERFLRRFRDFEPAGAFVRRLNGPFRSYERVPIAVRPSDLTNDC